MQSEDINNTDLVNQDENELVDVVVQSSVVTQSVEEVEETVSVEDMFSEEGVTEEIVVTEEVKVRPNIHTTSSYIHVGEPDPKMIDTLEHVRFIVPEAEEGQPPIPDEEQIVVDRIKLPTMNLTALSKLQSFLEEKDTEDLEKIGLDPKDLFTKIANCFINIDKAGTDEEGLENPSADWRQGVLTKKGDLVTTKINSANVKNTELKGDVALFKALSFLGIGDTLDAILPHSGFWVKITPPSDIDRIAFTRRISRIKVEHGRATSGLTFTNSSAVINKELFNFILNHITEGSVKGIGLDSLVKMIVPEDMRILAWQFARTFLPKGFIFSHDCMHFLTGCNNRESVLASIDKMLYIDNAKLTERQIEIIGLVTPRSITIEEYEEYHQEWKWKKYANVDLGNISFTFTSSSLEEHFQDGTDWVNNIGHRVNRALAESKGSLDEMSVIDEMLVATNLRNYSHYVEEIRLGAGVVYRDRATVRKVLESLSAVPEIASRFEEEFMKWRRHVTVALVGIPEYECPSCHKLNIVELKDTDITKIIPIDVMGVFFLMLTTKYQMNMS